MPIEVKKIKVDGQTVCLVTDDGRRLFALNLNSLETFISNLHAVREQIRRDLSICFVGKVSRDGAEHLIPLNGGRSLCGLETKERSWHSMYLVTIAIKPGEHWCKTCWRKAPQEWKHAEKE